MLTIRMVAMLIARAAEGNAHGDQDFGLRERSVVTWLFDQPFWLAWVKAMTGHSG